MIDIELLVKIAAGITAVAGAVAVITKVIKRAISIAIHDDMELHQKAIDESISKNQAVLDAKIDTMQKLLNNEMKSLQSQLQDYIDKQDDINDQMTSALLASTRNAINQAHDFYMKKQFIGSHSLFVITELYAAYKKLGGNSFVSQQMQDIKGLEVKSAESIEGETNEGNVV